MVGWVGRADILRRVEVPGAPWVTGRMKPLDTKLARETKGGAPFYNFASLLRAPYGKLRRDSPEHMSVIVPWSDFRAAAIPLCRLCGLLPAE